MLHADARPAPVLETRRALNRSLVLHVLVLGLVVGLPYLHKPPEVIEAPAIQAVLVAPLPASRPEPRPAPPVPEPVPVEPAPVVEEMAEVPPPVKTPAKIELPAPKVEEKPKVAEKPRVADKPAPPKPLVKLPSLNTAALDDEMKELQRQAQQVTRDRLLKEMEGQAVAMRASANQAEVDRYHGLIRNDVVNAWLRPPSARAGMVVTLRISTYPGGELAGVMVTRSSGDPAFDASARAAVEEAARRRSGRLQVPSDAALYSQFFRTFTMNFRPDDQ